MPAHIILVHDDPRFVKGVVEALRAVGHVVAAFSDPLEATGPIGAAPRLDILITRVRFTEGRGNGVALANGARLKRPDVKVLFTVAPENVDHVEGVAMFAVAPIDIPELVATVARLAEGTLS